MTTVAFDDLAGLAGTSLGSGEWLEVTQKRIDLFADATDDHQWIHVDPERARSGPFGAPIAHGFLTLSLVIPLWTALFDVSGVSTKVNYGVNRVRFPAPVPVGARIRLSGTVLSVTPVDGGAQITADVVVEIEGGTKPACVAQPVFRFYR
ncbi:MaoC family dehydratase [Umezawaea sp. NPDC059074]|uniref:MaoC family dehydratase n=1 Tax=Umezawaea sp. NPDC059074 TaxID=3346716 RepID=UPI0036C49A05